MGPADPGNPASIPQETLVEWGKKGYIRYLGERSDIRELMAMADVVVLPSYREGFPRVLLEAGMVRRAVVATDVPGCREIVENEKTGLLVKPGEVRPLFLAMRRLIQDSSLRDRLAQGLHERVKAEFSDSAINPKWKNLYDRIAGK